MSERSASQALKGRARGVMIGALIAGGWAVYGVSGLRLNASYLPLAIVAAVTAGLLMSGFAMQRRAGALPDATPVQSRAGKRAWRWFWLNFVAEIILLNIAVNLLQAPDLRIFWIPAISAVVGLHFWPMAYVSRVRSYWWVGAAMMAGSVVAALLMVQDGTLAPVVIPGEAIANAVILWLALAAAAATALSGKRILPGA